MASAQVTIKTTTTQMELIKSALEYYRVIALATKHRNDVFGMEMLRGEIGAEQLGQAIRPLTKDPRVTSLAVQSLLVELS